MTTEESAEIKELKRENAELRRTNEILKTASAFFAAELDGHGSDRRYIEDHQGHRDRPNGLRWGVEPICTQLTS